MLVRNKQSFNKGMMLAVTFFGVLLLIFSPIFGNGRNGLEYSDDFFNKLAKGSSYFIPEIGEQVGKFNGNTISATVKLDKPEMADKVFKILGASGAQIGVKDSSVTVTGDLGKLLSGALKDADAMYKNEGEKVSSAYGIPEKEAMTIWWTTLNKTVKELQKEKKISEANIILEVMRKGIEPAYNFYHIPAESVASQAFLLIAVLLFYIAYTMWWGYGIFYIFDGLGLSMTKAKVKKEV